ncbi:hypothetical protein N7530_012858 [Penicillium desertorum]|uniref:Uncharacterized protein n=1 Tax=Penicillium desertorum TaxID=1303715 RepID=A0A9W9WDM0_9EURO|nr:hypothetical protein N7530_012858 [Penicillium desertorum]
MKVAATPDLGEIRWFSDLPINRSGSAGHLEGEAGWRALGPYLRGRSACQLVHSHGGIRAAQKGGRLATGGFEAQIPLRQLAEGAWGGFPEAGGGGAMGPGAFVFPEEGRTFLRGGRTVPIHLTPGLWMEALESQVPPGRGVVGEAPGSGGETRSLDGWAGAPERGSRGSLSRQVGRRGLREKALQSQPPPPGGGGSVKRPPRRGRRYGIVIVGVVGLGWRVEGGDLPGGLRGLGPEGMPEGLVTWLYGFSND